MLTRAIKTQLVLLTVLAVIAVVVLGWYFLRIPSLVGIGRLNRPGMSGDSSSWKGWGHVRWFIEEVPAGAA
ncbi:hypothetical protein [Mycobacterium tuberculosis]|uniref:hypothetical protein n=1 Tax=Mycobacterium tuberculosis TaxID=1773 RepID=UPI0004B0685C